MRSKLFEELAIKEKFLYNSVVFIKETQNIAAKFNDRNKRIVFDPKKQVYVE